MKIERRERDPDTGEIVSGAGFGDVIGKIAAKLTGKTAKKLATKAAEKLVEKGAEKVGEKSGQLVGEKIYEKFSTKPGAPFGRSGAPSGASTPPEIKGKEIGKMLAASSPPARSVAPHVSPKKTTTLTRRGMLKINNVYADLL